MAVVGTYLPRRCGIATFSSDLLEAMAGVAPETEFHAVAMNDKSDGYQYPRRVQFEVSDHHLADYRLAAEFLNMSGIEVVCLQHEYGIFGGPDGKHIVELLRRLRMPVVTTLHTVLKDPSPGQKATLRRIVDLSDRVVVMAEKALDFLEDIYQVPRDKARLIHHGIPDVAFIDPNFYKDQFGVEGRKVILTFGLLGPGKGIENMVNALPTIVEKHPDAIYLVVGATHPGVLAHNGEEYRVGLQRLARELNVSKHLAFHNRFVDLKELTEFLSAADVYVTPYLSEKQICSGTLAYAMGTGNAVVSTPYWYAQEMLAEDRGVLVPFAEPGRLAQAIIGLFDDEVGRHATRKRAYAHTREMTWPQVAGQYLDLFCQVQRERLQQPRTKVSTAGGGDAQPAGDARRYTLGRPLPPDESDLPAIKLDHLRSLTDDTGLLRQARGVIPLRQGGYSTDDNAGALMVVLMAEDHVPDAELCRRLAVCYLSFLDYAFNEEARRFNGLLSYDRRWIDQAPDESQGRTVWALGETVARSGASSYLPLAAGLFHKALPAVNESSSLCAWAYGLMGAHAYLRRYSGETSVRRFREQLAQRLFAHFQRCDDPNWPWPLDTLTSDNARLPHALLLSGHFMQDHTMVDAALASLDWLLRVQTDPQGHLTPVGSEGWYPRSGEKARFHQQPFEASGLVQACLEAHRVTGDTRWEREAQRCLRWYLGDNDLRVPLVDHATGACAEVLRPGGASPDQPAHAALSWLLAAIAMHEHELEVTQVVERPVVTGGAERPVASGAERREARDPRPAETAHGAHEATEAPEAPVVTVAPSLAGNARRPGEPRRSLSPAG
ncbi:MAG: glycosyltransferase family 4 protein [Phycisphaeraceae bacterium]